MLDEEFPPKDQNKVPTPEVQVKREPGEEEITKTIDALAQQGAEQSRFERESGTWRAISMYNAAGLGPSDYLGLAESPQSGPLVPAGGGSTSRGGSSGAVQQNPAAREQLGFSYYRNNYNPARWRNIKSLMFKRGFACLYCGKNFSRRAHLERHKLIHTGEKPYICEVCGRRFNQKSSVKEHMKIHQKGMFQLLW
ncbi:Zinc finger protein 865 [Merluccius polli]|uniref:Zinc finger protein 865 n=1 Tax=Merluccius polli TaxID=89951 RepID=A0AA47MZN6_MERPO|nr:Zinc finger protein 865 [Merluccius polli]